VAAEIAELLDAGWQRTADGRAEAADIFDAASRQAPADAELPYAYGLVRLKQRQYREAAEQFAQAIAADPAHLPARQAEIWTLMLLKQFPQALVQLEALGAALPPEEPAEEIEAPRRLAARFMGRMFGFLEGPAGKAAREDLVVRHRQAVEAGFTTQRNDEFQAGRRAVLDRYDELALGHDEERDQTRVDQEAEKLQQGERIEQERGNIEGERAAMLERAEKLREELDARLSEFDRQMAPLDTAFNRLAAEAQTVQGEMIDIDRRIGRLLQSADDTDDEFLRRRYLRDADRLSAVYGDYEAQYDALDAEARQVNAQRAALTAERQGAIERHEAELERLDDRSGILSRNEKRLDREERDTTRPASGTSTRVRTLASKAQAFTTYEEFPLESERARLLAEAGK
jgi:tetratricopeptide (TPR) repeat protein